MRQARVNSGFTFIELLIVLVLIGTLSVLAVPRFKATVDSLRFRSFVKDVYYLCRHLQSLALSQRMTYCLNVDMDERKLCLFYKDSGELKPASGRLSMVYIVPPEVDITQRGEPGKRNFKLYFYPDSSLEDDMLDFEATGTGKLSISLGGESGSIKIE